MDCVKAKQVPVIDLTVNEDGDCGSSAPSRSLIELNVTPPLDINGNEILITTDTKTMQAIVYKKKKPHDEKAHEMPLKQPAATNSIPFNAYAQQQEQQRMQWPVFQQYSNVLQNGVQLPTKEQLQIDTKYILWLRYLRSYNGFRLFAQRYYRKAQAHSHAHIDLSALNQSKTRLFIESVLLKWWNSLDASEKEQYVLIAEMKKK